MEKLNALEYDSDFQGYIDLALNKNIDINQCLKVSLEESNIFFNQVPIEKQLFKYAEKKWTIKEILQHIIDTERILSYRVLRIVRNDKTKIPGFDENLYVANSNANQRNMDDLFHEFIEVRRSTISLFKGISDRSLSSIGNAGGKNISVRALGYIISGHLLHHINIIKQRYL